LYQILQIGKRSLRV